MDKITIAVQEHTISELQAQVAEQENALKEYEEDVRITVDWKELAEKAETIFPALSGCSCGVMSDSEGAYVLLFSTTDQEMEAEDIQIIKNWLKSETGFER